MIFEDFEAIAERLKRIQEQEMRSEKQTKQEIDDAADDSLIGNDEDSMCYEHYVDNYVGCDF
jgi:hypothetical protein